MNIPGSSRGVLGLARFKNEEYRLYLACLFLGSHAFRTKNIHCTYIHTFSVCLGLQPFKNEEYTLHLACVWAHTL